MYYINILVNTTYLSKVLISNTLFEKYKYHKGQLKKDLNTSNYLAIL